jgi:hypothetical protein
MDLLEDCGSFVGGLGRIVMRYQLSEVSRVIGSVWHSEERKIFSTPGTATSGSRIQQFASPPLFAPSLFFGAPYLIRPVTGSRHIGIIGPLSARCLSPSGGISTFASFSPFRPVCCTTRTW